MVIVTRGIGIDGNPLQFFVDGYLKKTYDSAVERVKKKWDYVCIVVGIPGAGKSQFAQMSARYFDPEFNINQIAFNSQEFIDITNNAKNYQAVVLDESFKSFNTKVTMSSDFLRIINHLQVIRRKQLYIFLCLPNFFDLNKTVALFRCNHLFIVYDDEGNRGRFQAFDRDTKRKLYIKGYKFIDYNAERANYYGKFTRCKAIDEEVYEKIKDEHLKMQDEELKGTTKRKDQYLINVFMYLKENLKYPTQTIADISGMCLRNVQDKLRKGKNI